MDATTAIITALGGAGGAWLLGWAAVVKARGEADSHRFRTRNLLQRLWDWVESKGHHHDVPPTLANDIRAQLEDHPDEPPRS